MTGKEVMTVQNKDLKNKKISLFFLTVLVCTFLLPLFAIPAHADEFGFEYTNPETGYVIYIADEEDLLTDSEEAQLIEDMKAITEYGNAGFVSCENNSVSTRQYAEQRYASVFGSESGSLLLIDMGMREFYIRNNGEISKIITTAYSNTISDNIYKYASDRYYYKFASVCFLQELELLRGGKIAQPMRYISATLLAHILGLLINYLVLRAVTVPRTAGNHEVIDAAQVDFILKNPSSRLTNTSRVYSPIRSSGGGGGGRSGGGGFSGGGGSGGGHRF
jgi:uncharacterized protein